jgi:hypothetical protein
LRDPARALAHALRRVRDPYRCRCALFRVTPQRCLGVPESR